MSARRHFGASALAMFIASGAVAQEPPPASNFVVSMRAAFDLCPGLVTGTVAFPSDSDAAAVGLKVVEEAGKAPALESVLQDRDVVRVDFDVLKRRCDVFYMGAPFTIVFDAAKEHIVDRLKFKKLNDINNGAISGGTYILLTADLKRRRQFIYFQNPGTKTTVIGFTEKANF